MNKKIKYHIRNIIKMTIQNTVLPVAYRLAEFKYKGEKKLYVFADAHHTSLPFSLEAMYDYVVLKGIEPTCHFYDYTHEGSFKSLLHALSFMKVLAKAKYIFICDTFMPVSACNISGETKVVQLCHFSGPLKKIGYATEDDVPKYYKGNVFKNYSLVSVSAEMYVPLITDAMRQKDGVVKALGVSRSDIYFDNAWVERCREEFYCAFPEAKNKKVLLWAPTFRGKASSPDALDNESLSCLQEKLGEEWFVLIKHHPHDDAMATNERYRSNCSISSERLLPIVDFLITDYSTVVLDYLAFSKPFILYAPDLDEYEKTRGFFIDYRSITENLVVDARDLDIMVKKVYQQWFEGNDKSIDKCKDMFVSACDGKATERIFDYIHTI